MPPFIPALVRAVRKPSAVPALIFLVFAAVNALKISFFYRCLIDVPLLSSFPLLFQSFFRNIILCVFILIFLTRPRRWFWLAGFYLLQTFYMALNLTYHFSLNEYLRFSQFIGLYSEAVDLARNTKVPLDARLWVLAADAPLVIAMIIVYSKFWRVNKRVFFKPALRCAAVAVVAAVLLWNPQSFSSTYNMADPSFSDVAMVKKYGLLVFNIADLLNYRKTNEHSLGLRYGPEISAPAVKSKHPDFVLIQVESMGAYIIDRKYKGTFVTPFLHDLSGKCFFFPFALSYHEAGLTTDCEFSVINSLEPLADFPTNRLKNYRYANSMLKRLVKGNYETFVFHGNWGSFDNRNEIFKKMGYDKFYDIAAMGLKEISWGAPDGGVFDFVKTRLPAQREPFLYHIITMSSHEPFTLVNPYYRNELFDSIPDDHSKAYYNSMSYVDGELSSFIKSIRETNPSCYIFMYGDHTPINSFIVHKKASYTYDSRFFEYVPLFVITPDSRVHCETNCAASFLDIAPTVLSLSGIAYRLRTDGENLLNVPLADGHLPFRGGTYLRSELYAKIKQYR
jgi:phosphoglycerol transferase MdoB-like AlkP superfamily enzyme